MARNKSAEHSERHMAILKECKRPEYGAVNQEIPAILDDHGKATVLAT